MPDPTAQLLQRMHRGDESAARALWSALAGRMRSYAATVLPQPLRSHSADVVQTVFCNILNLPSSRIRAIEDGPAFLLMSVRNECITLIRSSRSRVKREQATTPSQTPEHGTESALSAALELLSRREREVVVLKHIAGLTFDQIEQSTGTNRNTAASIYRVARLKLQEILSEISPEINAAKKEAVRG